MFLSDDLTTQIGTFALLPQSSARCACPLIAAGGIATADGVAAALGLGAAAVQIGIVVPAVDEATTSALHRAALKSDAAKHTALTNVFTGRPARAIVNRLVAEIGPIAQGAPPFPLAASAVAPLRAKAEPLGVDGFSPLWAGQTRQVAGPVLPPTSHGRSPPICETEGVASPLVPSPKSRVRYPHPELCRLWWLALGRRARPGGERQHCRRELGGLHWF